MDCEQAPDGFGCIVFDRTDREADARRFYLIARQATLVDDASLARRRRRAHLRPQRALEARHAQGIVPGGRRADRPAIAA